MQNIPFNLPPDMQEAYEFLSLVLPQGSYTYGTSCVGINQPWRDTPVQELLAIIQVSMANSSIGLNTYFALSAFAQGWHPIVKKDGKEGKAFRTQDNAVAQKCLWLDIDCGKNDSVYANETEAIQALHNFLRATHLPIPIIVSSGHGLHVYWPFTDTISTNHWRQLAHILKTLCVYFNFVTDHSRTTDPASVLRLPYTHNYDIANKYNGATTPVRVLVKASATPTLTLANLLVKAVRDNRLQIAPVKSQVSTQAVDGVLSAPTDLHFDTASFNGPLRSPLRIVQECKQVKTAGLGTYTQWYNMMLVMKHCVNGEQAVHLISKTDPSRYDYHTTQTKFQQATEGGYGPCRCDTFDNKDPGICQSCPYWGKITSPLMLGDVHQPTTTVKMAPAAISPVGDSTVVPVDAIPTMEVMPYHTKEFSVVPGKGIVWHKRQLVTGEALDPDEEDKHYITKDILISDTEVYVHSVCVDTTGETVKRSYVIRKQSPGKAAEDILLDIDSNLGSQPMIKWLGNHAMLPIHPRYNKQMSDFMSVYLAAVQNRLPEIFVRDHFGWVKTQDKYTGQQQEGFIVGNTMYSEQGPSPVKLDERAQQLADPFVPTGRLEVWKHIPKMYRILDQPFPALMLCTAFAAPFMRYGTGVATNIAYSLWDIKGGKGKSTVLEAASGVWGNPRDILQSKNDTHASRFQKYTVYKNLPIFIDEVTTMKESDVTDLIYDIVNGREKSRSTAGGTGLAKQGRWDTITLFTSNKSLYEMLRSYRAQTDATHMRVIEMQCDFKDYTGTDYQRYISTICGTIRQHYGLAGPAFLEYCFAHPEVIDNIQREVEDFVQKYSRASDERFWMYGTGITLAAARAAVAAGLLDYDIDGWLLPYAVNVMLPHIRAVVRQAAPTGPNLLADFLNEHLSNTLVVMSADRKPDQQDSNTQSGLDTYVRTYPVHSLCVRQELDTNTYYVSSKQLQIWCMQNNLSLDVLLQELQQHGMWRPADKLQYALGRNVKSVDRSRVMAYKFTIPE